VRLWAPHALALPTGATPAGADPGGADPAVAVAAARLRG